MIRRSTWHVLPLLLTLVLAGCGGSQSKSSSSAGYAGSADTMTELQRDSMLSRSTIPGARGVGAAMRAADATSRGIRSADTVSP
jgi:hypothetical protein